MRSFLKIFSQFLGIMAISVSCTKNIDIELPPDAAQVIVEGNIENGRPPFVLLTRSFEVFSPLNVNDLSGYFIHDAQIRVSSAQDTVQLVEFCLQDLPLSPEEQSTLLESFGFSIDSGAVLPDVCVYTVADIFSFFTSGSCSFMGEENRSYDLRILSEGKTFSAQTRIPYAVPMDSLSWRPHPDPLRTDLVSVYVNLAFPSIPGNFIRYQTQRNQEPFYFPRTQSVYDDKLVAGTYVSLPVERGQDPNERIDFDNFSYFWKGDTVSVKWMNIDARTFDFFYTLENDGGGSPFASYLRVKSNIQGEGSLGIWGGYAVRYYTLIVPE